MPYTLAISFSNIQYYYGLPMICVGLAFDSGDEQNLSSIKTKEGLFPDPNKLPEFDLSRLENELTRYRKYVESYRVVNLEKPMTVDDKGSETPERYLDGYLETINAILSSNLMILSEGIKICYVHVPIYEDGKIMPIQKSLLTSHPIFKYPLVFQSKNNFNKLMHLARLFATYEYLKRRRGLRRYINGYVKHTSLDLLQITRILWRSPNVQHYTGYFVGYPDIIVRTWKESKKIPLVPGQEMKIFPIARFCLGITDELKNESCIQSSTKRPFGSVITSKQFERCSSCRKKSLHIRCLYQHPKCDGSQVLCGNSSFAGNVCNGNFSIYLSIFNDVLKVGRCILSRTIGRLLEQSAFDGLIYYPINSIDAAHNIERKVATYLRNKVRHLNAYGIGRVSRTVKTKERFEHVRLLSNKAKSNERQYAYHGIKQLLQKTNSPEIRSLIALESRKIDLAQNWCIDENLEMNQTELVKETQFKRIEGKIEGIVGSFVFVGKKAYALNSLQGFVVECQ